MSRSLCRFLPGGIHTDCVRCGAAAAGLAVRVPPWSPFPPGPPLYLVAAQRLVPVMSER